MFQPIRQGFVKLGIFPKDWGWTVQKYSFRHHLTEQLQRKMESLAVVAPGLEKMELFNLSNLS